MFLSVRPCIQRSLLPSTRGEHAPAARQSMRPCRAFDDDRPLVSMSTEEAEKLLGVPSSSSFETILERKNALLSEAGSDKQRAMAVENAYDVIFMQSMRKRLTGELNVSTKVRYADVPQGPRKASLANQQRGAPASSPKVGLPGGASLAIAAPKQELATQQAAVYGGLATWAILQAVLEQPAVQLGDTAGLQLSLALAYSIYSFKESKKMGLGKAIGMSIAALIVGAMLGTVLQNWLRVDIVPIGNFQSPGVFCTEWVLLVMLLGSLFLV